MIGGSSEQDDETVSTAASTQVALLVAVFVSALINGGILVLIPLWLFLYRNPADTLQWCCYSCADTHLSWVSAQPDLELGEINKGDSVRSTEPQKTRTEEHLKLEQNNDDQHLLQPEPS